MYEAARKSIRIVLRNEGYNEAALVLRANAYRTDGPWTLPVAPGQRVTRDLDLNASHGWYDFSATGNRFERRFAGRMETGNHSISDPAV